MARDQYSTLQIAKLLGIERERLRVWVDKGYIEPSIQKAKGQGTKSLFARLDIYAVALFRMLVEKGFTRDFASKFVKGFVHRGIEAFGYVIFKEDEVGIIETEIYSPGEWALHLPTGNIADYDPESNTMNFREKSSRENWQFIYMLDLRMLRERIDAQLGQ
jgi:hypothetical protein